jgi:hypothetical protein
MTATVGEFTRSSLTSWRVEEGEKDQIVRQEQQHREEGDDDDEQRQRTVALGRPSAPEPMSLEMRDYLLLEEGKEPCSQPSPSLSHPVIDPLFKPPAMLSNQ